MMRAFVQTRLSGRPAAFLLLVVHIEAMLAHPVLYGRSLWWYLIGKRMRARLHLAPLLGQTPHAFALWLARNGALPPVEQSAKPPRIVALIQDGEGSAATLASLLAESIEARVVSAVSDIEWAISDGKSWIMPVANGDIIASGAGGYYRAAAARAPENCRVIYADDDLIDRKGRRHKPHFKPDWNSELFRHFDYVTGAALVRAARAPSIKGHEPDWAARLVTEAVDDSERENGAIIHTHHILHHRRSRPAPRLPLAQRLPARAQETLPRVSVLVPTRNRVDLLANCLEGLSRTEYPQAPEIIVIDNGSDDPATLAYLAQLDPAAARVLRDDGPFNFAAINNRAVQQASGALLCFLNNDIEIEETGWLAAMARQAVRPDVGAVGAQLLYPDGRIQHAGVVIGIGGAAAHAHRLLKPDEEGYFHRHALPQFVSAVTAACMVVDRTKFDAVGGFDAERFAVSFNDVDLCLRLGARGWRSLYEPRARLVHHESVSRGLDRDKTGAARQAREAAFLNDLWNTRLATQGATPDPFHHPHLSRLSEHFVPAL